MTLFFECTYVEVFLATLVASVPCAVIVVSSCIRALVMRKNHFNLADSVSDDECKEKDAVDTSPALA